MVLPLSPVHLGDDRDHFPQKGLRQRFGLNNDDGDDDHEDPTCDIDDCAGLAASLSVGRNARHLFPCGVPESRIMIVNMIIISSGHTEKIMIQKKQANSVMDKQAVIIRNLGSDTQQDVSNLNHLVNSSRTRLSATSPGITKPSSCLEDNISNGGPARL